ncbi:protein phosphatase inhibitor 2 [Echinococcus multilocularis]|uniref:Protein phosphatase inhibitor 2 n=1 Tax=Echinococcus multilocularis TaxID=6211 RepID=A0A068Y540_ECHMU|nr:protein phosphatase inhibitor 2 [Echinococcus multilocularis]
MSEEEEHPKGILKHTNTNEKKNKTFQWDEMNILATYHPTDKTYGHMKVDEPPTPYNFEYNASQTPSQGVSAEALASKLAGISDKPPGMLVDRKHDTDATLAPEEAEHRRKFEEKRKKHYNEYQAVLAMRGSHSSGTGEDEDEDDDYVDPIAARNAKINSQTHAPHNPK